MARRNKALPGDDLRMAVRNCDLAEVQRLLAQGADPNTFDTDGQTALTICGRRGSAEIAAALLQAGALPDACGTSYVRTPLCYAANKGDVALARVLVEGGADVNVLQAAETPLTCATTSGNLEVMRLLLESGAQVTCKNGKSALESITQYTKNPEAVERLLREFGADQSITEFVAVRHSDGNLCGAETEESEDGRDG